MGIGAEYAGMSEKEIEDLLALKAAKRRREKIAAKASRKTDMPYLGEPEDLKRGSVTGAKKGAVPQGAKTTSSYKEKRELAPQIPPEKLHLQRGWSDLKPEEQERRKTAQAGKIRKLTAQTAPSDAEEAPTGDPYEDAKAKKVGGLGKGSMDPLRARRQRAKTKKSLRQI